MCSFVFRLSLFEHNFVSELDFGYTHHCFATTFPPEGLIKCNLILSYMVYVCLLSMCMYVSLLSVLMELQVRSHSRLLVI